MPRSKSHGRSKSQTRSKSRSRKNANSSKGKIRTPKSEPSRSRSRGRPRKLAVSKSPARRSPIKKTPNKQEHKTPAKTPSKIQRQASRSSSRGRPSKSPHLPSFEKIQKSIQKNLPSVQKIQKTLTPVTSAVQRASRSVVKKIEEEAPRALHKLNLSRSRSPKKVLGWVQSTKNNVCYTTQNLYNRTRFQLRKTIRYVRANQTDIFWTIVMLGFIGLLFYVFYYKGNRLDPVSKYCREQYNKAAQYISTQYHNARDYYYKK